MAQRENKFVCLGRLYVDIYRDIFVLNLSFIQYPSTFKRKILVSAPETAQMIFVKFINNRQIDLARNYLKKSTTKPSKARHPIPIYNDRFSRYSYSIN